VRSRVEAGELLLHAAYFDVATGVMTVCNPETKKFAVLEGE
jgi:carbonic anhydrase